MCKYPGLNSGLMGWDGSGIAGRHSNVDTKVGVQIESVEPQHMRGALHSEFSPSVQIVDMFIDG